VHLNLAYRWFCRLGLEGDVPNHSTFSKNRHGRLRDSVCCASYSRRREGAASRRVLSAAKDLPSMQV
jgi:transposase